MHILGGCAACCRVIAVNSSILCAQYDMCKNLLPGSAVPLLLQLPCCWWCRATPLPRSGVWACAPIYADHTKIMTIHERCHDGH
jgi:hypothetical protein